MAAGGALGLMALGGAGGLALGHATAEPGHDRAGLVSDGAPGQAGGPDGQQFHAPPGTAPGLPPNLAPEADDGHGALPDQESARLPHQLIPGPGSTASTPPAVPSRTT
ncbi:hypothetical protein [Nocardioides mesophilus]|uniref:Uncharacterized protein n=1 Tax=Nocardioides mesophilus TaxID=433659 RepID=A0A7G9RG30_9ACTN|nr:hypothetical protein [Nocardioides mesophilus]QNN54555.1 hypothetical protein H9L09_09745 [Nocardioides mesophilus]